MKIFCDPKNLEEYEAFMDFCEYHKVTWRSGNPPREVMGFSKGTRYFVGYGTPNTLTFGDIAPNMPDGFREYIGGLKKPLCIKNPLSSLRNS